VRRMVRCVVQQGPARPQGKPASLRTGLAIPSSPSLARTLCSSGRRLLPGWLGCAFWVKGGEELVVWRMVRCVVQQGPARSQGGPASLRTGLAIRGSHTLLFVQVLTARLAGVRVLGERHEGINGGGWAASQVRRSARACPTARETRVPADRARHPELAIPGSHTLLFGQALTGRLAGVRVLGERRSGRHLLPVSAWLAQHNPTRSLSDDPCRRAEPRR